MILSIIQLGHYREAFKRSSHLKISNTTHRQHIRYIAEPPEGYETKALANAGDMYTEYILEKSPAIDIYLMNAHHSIQKSLFP